MPKYSLLLFDLDDTVVEFTRVRRDSFVATAREFGAPVDGASLYAHFSRVSDELWAGHRAGRVSLREVRESRFAAVLSPYGIDPAAFTRRFYERVAEDPELMPGADEGIRSLAKRYRLVGLSNGKKEVQDIRLARAGLADCFSFLVGPEDCGFAKPHGEPFRLALHRAGDVPPTEVLVVGDGFETDIVGAANLGLDSCWINATGRPRPGESPVPTFEAADLPSLDRLLHE